MSQVLKGTGGQTFQKDTTIGGLRLGNFQASGVLSTAYQLLPEDAGKTLSWDTTAGLVATLPPLASVPDGASYYLFGAAVGGTIKATTGEFIFAGTAGNQTQLTVKAAGSVQLTKSGTLWFMSGGSMLTVASAEFAALLSPTGWQKLPSGLIVQWGSFVATAGAVNTAGTGWVNYPIQFPTRAVQVNMQQQAVDNVLCSYSAAASPTDAGRFSWAFLSAAAGLTRNVGYTAIGY